MKQTKFNRYYQFSCMGILIASFYPLSMGIRVIADMLEYGTVWKENYPKYIIPYTPISIALIIGVLLMPLCMKLFRRFALAGGGAAATGVFFAMELLFEQKVVVKTDELLASLEDWQMFMCYVPTRYKTQTPIEILMGEYNPAFKLHFYIISVVLILSLLNSFYGFGQMLRSGEPKRKKALILQSACSVTFLGLCILACFTAFWRDGSLQVSALSAVLMSVFFILFGVTCGLFAASFLLGKRKSLSVCFPSALAAVMTLLMYVGELILLHGNLYRLGSGFLFAPLPWIRFAPIDILVIAAASAVTALTARWLNRKGT